MSKTVSIILIAVMLLFMAAVGGGFFILWNKISQLPQATAKPKPMPVAEDENTLGPLFPLDTMIVNLADQGGKRYLRVTMSLELSNADAEKTIKNRLPEIRDAILMILPSKQYADISTTEGKIALRKELMDKINSLLTKGHVNNIYFTEFVVQ
jgi:flagellar FliL protein